MKILLKDIKSARWAIIVIIAYFAFLKNYLYTLCPLTLFTGYPCPGCGMTRAMFCVLRLDFAGAWQMHPFIYPIMFLAVWFCYNRYISGKKMKNWLMHYLNMRVNMSTNQYYSQQMIIQLQ